MIAWDIIIYISCTFFATIYILNQTEQLRPKRKENYENRMRKPNEREKLYISVTTVQFLL